MDVLSSNLSLSPDSANQEQWTGYLGSLDWGPGHRDDAAFTAFLRAASLRIDPELAYKVVTGLIEEGGGTYNPNKLRSQLERAYHYVGTSVTKPVAIFQPPVLAFDPAKLKEIAAKAPDIDRNWLKWKSPVLVKDVSSATFLDHLYQPEEKVLVFTSLLSQGEHLYEVGKDNAPPPRLTAEGVWFLVNPVDGQNHPNPRQENKESRRSEESVTSWRYLVLESDEADKDDWLSCLVQLPLRISAIYTSGGKSIHALVRLDAGSKQHWDTMRDQIRPIMVPLGADANAMTGVRLSRLPGAMRGLSKQELLYLNPNPNGKPIFP